MGGGSTSRAPPCLNLGHCLYARLPSPRQGKSPGPYAGPYSLTSLLGPRLPRSLFLGQGSSNCPSGLPRRVANTPRTPPLLRRQRVCAGPAGRAIPPPSQAQTARDLLSLPPPHGQDPLTPPPSSKTPSPSGRPRVPPPGRLWELQAQAGGMKFWVLNSGLSEMRWSQMAGLPVATAGIEEREGCEVCVRQSVHI